MIAAAVSAAIGQLSKPFTSAVFYGNDFDIRTAFQAGGFPSTHSSVRYLCFFFPSSLRHPLGDLAPLPYLPKYVLKHSLGGKKKTIRFSILLAVVFFFLFRFIIFIFSCPLLSFCYLQMIDRCRHSDLHWPWKVHRYWIFLWKRDMIRKTFFALLLVLLAKCLNCSHLFSDWSMMWMQGFLWCNIRFSSCLCWPCHVWCTGLWWLSFLFLCLVFCVPVKDSQNRPHYCTLSLN